MSNTPGAPRAAYLTPVTHAIDGLRQELVDISLDIHAHPELDYQGANAEEETQIEQPAAEAPASQLAEPVAAAEALAPVKPKRSRSKKAQAAAA